MGWVYTHTPAVLVRLLLGSSQILPEYTIKGAKSLLQSIMSMIITVVSCVPYIIINFYLDGQQKSENVVDAFVIFPYNNPETSRRKSKARRVSVIIRKKGKEKNQVIIN